MLGGSRGERGFTLVEVLAALMVFTIVTLGVIPLLAASLRGSNLARTSNVAKNLAVRAMERVRGLPYHRGLVTEGGVVVPVDILDLYHPGEAQPTTTTCTSSSGGNPACPDDIPAGFTMTFNATFVANNGVTALSPASYDYSATDTAKEEPPSSLLHMEIIIRWRAVTGQTRTYELDNLVGDRAFGGLDVRGVAHVEYGVQVATSFEDSDGEVHALTAIAGTAKSDVQVRVDETADQTVQAANLVLADTNGVQEDQALGAVADFHAPPSQTTIADVVDNSPDTISLPSALHQIAGVERSSATGLRVFAAGDTPEAEGTFSLLASGGADRFWVDNPASNRGARGAELDLIPSAKLLTLTEVAGGTPMEGATSAITGDLGIAGVQANGRVEFDGLRLFPAQFVLDQLAGGSGSEFGGAVVVIEDFEASVSCNASGTGAVTPPSVAWEATVRYWQDPEDNETNGRYVTQDVAGDDPSDLLADIFAAAPLVYEEPNDPLVPDPEALDLYLFENETNPGYLRSWSSTVDVGDDVSITPDNRAAEADLDGALRIDTVPIPALGDEFPFTVTLGGLNCEAVDFR